MSSSSLETAKVVTSVKAGSKVYFVNEVVLSGWTYMVRLVTSYPDQ